MAVRKPEMHADIHAPGVAGSSRGSGSASRRQAACHSVGLQGRSWNDASLGDHLASRGDTDQESRPETGMFSPKLFKAPEGTHRSIVIPDFGMRDTQGT